MKRLSIASNLVAAALMLSAAPSDAIAQRRVNPNRAAGTLNNADPQFGRQRNRIPGDPRNRRPAGGDQLRPRPNPRDPNFKRDLQRRLMQAIGLSDDQRVRMQEIRRASEDDAIAVGRRIRQARAALDREIMSEPYNEASVSRAIEEMASAHAEKTRLEARIRAQLRRVLTPEQVLRYHEIEKQLRREMRQQLQQGQQDREFGAMDFRPPHPPPPGHFEEVDLMVLLLSTL
jgi:Spy/CpxP family protein refolding chaperone